MMHGLLTLLLLIAHPQDDALPTRIDAAMKGRIAKLADAWWKARPRTRFEEWDPSKRAALEEEACAIGAIPEGKLEEVVETLWKPVAKFGPRGEGRGGKATIQTPYGEAWFYVQGGGKDKGLVIGLHGGGEGAGSADEPKGKWKLPDCIGMYPQGIRLLHDTWNTVHGENFVLTLIEIAKAQYQIDPDRVFVAGFSMGGTGSWFLAGRHPDLFAGAMPYSGVLMAEPMSQVPRKEDVVRVQHGLVPNVRNLAMWYTIGLADPQCQPGTYLFVADRLDELRNADPGGYEEIHFTATPGIGHAFPPGEPEAGFRFMKDRVRDTFPKTLVWEYAAAPFPLPDEEDKTSRCRKRIFYWLGCDDAADFQLVRAELQDNTITVRAERRAAGIRGITIFLNDRMIDPSSDVVVVSEGSEVWRGRPKPDLWTVLETLDDKVDRKMVFDRRITL